MAERTFTMGNFKVHHIFSPVPNFDNKAQFYVFNFKNFLLSEKIADEIKKSYISELKSFPRYKETLETENTIRVKVDRFVKLIVSPTLGEISKVMEYLIDANDIPFFTVAFLEVVLRDIEIIKGDGKHFFSNYNYDLDCACASILRSSFADGFELGDYFARYLIAEKVTPLHMFGGVK